ncbi:MAG: peptide deformylase [Candidatus Omnitrophica bacterium]|nr:peptide deformylase [Candidatus Omnitrophota bacterium]
MNTPALKIRIYGDPCLRKKNVPVKEVGPGERMVMQAMIGTMYQAKGVGLAAPQVGINQRFFVLDIGDGPMIVTNPEIIKRSGSAVMEEGCLSVPEVTIAVTRSEELTLRYTDENNHARKLTCNGLLARVIQHEMDHLNGVLIDHYASHEEKEKFKERLAILQAKQKA